MNIGQRIRTRRTEQGLSQEALARRADVSLKVVSRLETGGITDPHYSTISRIAHALDASTSELLGEPAAPLGGERSLAEAAAASQVDLGDPVEVFSSARRTALTVFERLERDFNAIRGKRSAAKELNTLFSEVCWVRLGLALILTDENLASTFVAEEEARYAFERLRRVAARFDDLADEISEEAEKHSDVPDLDALRFFRKGA
jgi:transcriptional regulator with XRE-family HTH domain